MLNRIAAVALLFAVLILILAVPPAASADPPTTAAYWQDGTADPEYKACFRNVQDGRTALLMVNTPADPPVYTWKYHCRSIKGFEDGVYSCFLRDGKPMMEPWNWNEPTQVVTPVAVPTATPFAPVIQCPSGVCPLRR